MNRVYTRINWQNDPSTETPLNETNLNNMDVGIYNIDGEIVTLDTTKANQQDLLTCLSGVTYNTTTGVFTFTYKNGTSVTVDLNIEKIPVSFSMDEQGVITMKTADGTEFTADVGSLIKTYSFANTSEITWTVTTDAQGNKTVTPALVDGGIAEGKLQVNFLADCRAAKSDAQTAATASHTEALVSEGYSQGTQDGEPVGTSSPYYHANAKYWAEEAAASSTGDMLKSVYDTNNNGMVDTSDDVEAINLIPFPYTETTKTVNGITFTVNADGSITANGTATANATFRLADLNLTLGDVLTLSRGLSNGDYGFKIICFYAADYTKYNPNLGNYEYIVLPTIPITGSYRFYIQCNANKTFSNLVVKPMLEVGTHAHAYKPYIGYESLTDAVLDINERVGENKNLIPFPYSVSGSKTISGVTFTIDADGTIHANGTATANVVFVFSNNNIPAIVGKTYSIITNCSVTESASICCQIYDSGFNQAFCTWGSIGNTRGQTLTASYTTYYGRIAINAGQVCNDVTWKPVFEQGQVSDYIDGTIYENVAYLRNNLFVVEEKTVLENYTISELTTTDTIQCDVSKSGYKPIGVVGYDVSVGNTISIKNPAILKNYVENNTHYLCIHNPVYNPMPITYFKVRILYIKA